MSVRLRLLAALLAGLAIAAIAVAVATAMKADHELEEVFDANLAQNASLLLLRLGDELDEIDTEHAPTPHKYAKRLSFQVWKDGRTLLLHSADAAGARFSDTREGYSTVEQGGRTWRVFSQRDAKGEYLVQVRDDVSRRRKVIVEILGALAAPLAIAAPLVPLLVWIAVGRAFRPLARVSEEIARRDPGYLEPIGGEVPAEIAPVVARLNALLARVRESLARERQFTSDAAHELRTPLAALRAQLQVAQGAQAAAGRDQAIAHALAAGERATRLVEQLLTLARLDHAAWKATAAPFEVHRVVAGVLADHAHAAAGRRIELAWQGDAGLRATGHADLVAIAIGNLVDNAIRYSPPGTAVTVAAARDGASVRLQVQDQGPGIPPARREEALARFTRLDPHAAAGSGLGLSIAARVAELHGAPLELADGAAGRGLTATIRLAGA